MPHRGFLVVAAVSVIGGVPAFSQTSATSGGATSDKAAAYYEFIVGRQRESEGDIEGALSAYRRAAQLDPSSAEIHAEAAAMYARQNRADDAIAEAEAALKIDAANGEAHWVLGGVYAALVSSQAELGRSDGSPAVRGYAAKAILHLEKARDLRPNTPGLEVLLGRLYVATGAYDRAIALLAEALAEDPGSSETSVLLAQAYWGGGRRDQAIRTLEDASSAVIESYRVLLELASFYERDEKWRQAADAYKRALDQNPSNPELKVRRASALINAGEGQAARDLMREVVKERPTEPAVLYLLSQAERQAKDLEAAEAAARRLIALAPRDLRGPFSLAQVFEHKHESRRVIETLQPIAEAPVNGPPRQVSTLLVHLAFAYQDVQQHDRALAAFERARKLAPDDDAIDSYLAQAHLAAHEPGKALEVARDALGRHPDNLRLLRLQAQALSQTGHLSEAVVMLQQEVTKRADPEAHLALAALFVEAKQLGEAEKILDSARAKFP
ncbi:MAG: tetratricopeptide repeat protein, partial [Acidobacteria bacterium]|nr:tetratricopeptide repeat protein [Acidobacteriota bacterium]